MCPWHPCDLRPAPCAHPYFPTSLLPYKMTYYNGIYIQQTLLDAMNTCNRKAICRYAANPDGTLSSPYILDACIPYAASKTDLPLLKLLLGLHDLPYDVIKAVYWPEASFRLILDDANEKCAAYPAAIAAAPAFLRATMRMQLSACKRELQRGAMAVLASAALQCTKDRVQAILETPLAAL
jgi:hypothetical protein